MSVNLGSAVGSIELRTDGVTRGVRSAVAALRDFEGQTSTAGRNLDQIGRAGDAAGAAVARGAKQAEAGVRELARSTEDVGAALGRLSGAAGIAGGALAAGLGAAAKSAADLQSQVALISTIRPDINVAQVGDAIQAMSTRVAQSTKQLSESLYNVFSSVDVSQEQAIKLTEGFAKGAVAARTDAETFGTAVLGVMNAYKLSVGDAGHVSDVFFQTINKGVINGEQLASGLGNVAQAAKYAGVNFDTLGALIAGVTKEGGEAATNVNNLNNVLQKLVTADVQSGLAAMGIATKDASGNFRDILAVLADLKTALDGMDQASRAATLQKLFPDAQARTGIQTLLSQLEFVKGVAQDNAAAAGVATAAYEKMGNTAAAQAQILKNTLIATLQDAGEIALPGLIGAAEQIKGLVQAFQGLPAPVRTAAVTAAEVAAAFLLLGSGAIKVTTTAVEIAAAMQRIAVAMRAAQVAGVSLTTVLAGIGVAGIASEVALRSITGEGLADAAKSLVRYGDLLQQGREDAKAFFEAHKGNLPAIGDEIERARKRLAELNAENARFANFSKESLLDLPFAPQRNKEINNLQLYIDRLEEMRRTEAAIAQDRELRNRQKLPEGFIGPPVPFAGPPIPPGFGAEADKGAAALGNVAAAAAQARDAMGGAAGAADQLLTKINPTQAQVFADRMAAISGAMGQIQAVAGPMQAALDAINAKIAAGIPLTAQESALYGQLPGQLGAASTATSSLAIALAQTAAQSAAASGGIAAFGGQFTGAIGGVSTLNGELQRLMGVQANLNSQMRAFSAEDAELTQTYNLFKARADALEAQKKAGGLTAAEQAELDKYTGLLATIGQKLGENAAKERELAEARLSNVNAIRQAAQAMAAMNAADLAAKQDPFAGREDRRTAVGRDLTPPAPVSVPVQPTGMAEGAKAIAAALGVPVPVPVVPRIEGLGGGAANATNAIAASMGLGGAGGATIAVTADTSAAQAAIQAVRDRLTEINNQQTVAQIAAQDNASAPAAAVKEAVERIPTTWTVVLNAVDNATPTINGLIGAISQVPPTLSITATVNTAGALAAIADLRAYMPASPAEKGPFKTLPNWYSVFDSLEPAGEEAVETVGRTAAAMARGVAAGMADVTAEGAKAAAELTSTVSQAVNAADDALAKIRAFRAPNPAQFRRFRDAVIPLIAVFDGQGPIPEAAAKWAEGAGKIFAAVSSGADALAKLGTLMRPTDRSISDFRDAAQFVVNTIGRVARDSDAKLTEAGATWAEAAQKVFGAIGSGVDALTKLSGFKRPADKALTDFRDVSQFAVNLIAQVAADIEDQALPKAADWADAAQKIFGAIGSGVEALTKLHTFKRPTDQAVSTFRDVSQYAVNLIAQVAADIEGQALPRAGAWAEAAQKIFAAIASGVEALSKLNDFVRPTDAALRSFRDVTRLAVDLIGEAARATDAELVAAAATYAEGASKVLALVGSGSEALSRIGREGFVAPDRGSLDRIAVATRDAVIAVGEAARLVEDDLVRAAATYAEGAGRAVGLLGQAYTAFKGASSFTPPSAAQIRAIANVAAETVRRIGEAAAAMDREVVRAAGEFGENGGKAIGVIGATLSAFSSAKDFVAPSKEAIDGVVSVAVYAAGRLADVARGFDAGTLVRLGEFGDAVGSGLGAIRAALDIGDAFAKEGRVSPADAIGGALAQFQAGLGPLDQLVTVSEEYKRRGEAIGNNVAQTYAAIARGLPGYTPESQAATGTGARAGQQTIVHRYEGTIQFQMMAENGGWVVRSLQADGASREAVAGMVADLLMDDPAAA